MPNCSTCHLAAITASHSATAVRDLGIAGAFSVCALPALAIRHKRTIADTDADTVDRKAARP